MKSLYAPFLYWNIWIGIAAFGLSLQASFLFTGIWRPKAIHLLIGCGAILVYNLHRLQALHMARAIEQDDRFIKLRQWKGGMYFSAIIALTVCLASLNWFSYRQLAGMLLPIGLALAYSLPLFRGRRLRDIHYIKVFLVGAVWGWVTVVWPLKFGGYPLDNKVAWMLLERSLFIFAFSLPFDLRDLEMDRQQGVQTLAHHLGLTGIRRMATAAALGMIPCIYANFTLGVYSEIQVAVLSFTVLMTCLLIWGSRADRPDYYYTGFMDGLMILQTTLIWLASLITS